MPVSTFSSSWFSERSLVPCVTGMCVTHQVGGQRPSLNNSTVLYYLTTCYLRSHSDSRKLTQSQIQQVYILHTFEACNFRSPCQRTTKSLVVYKQAPPAELLYPLVSFHNRNFLFCILPPRKKGRQARMRYKKSSHIHLICGYSTNWSKKPRKSPTHVAAHLQAPSDIFCVHNVHFDIPSSS